MDGSHGPSGSMTDLEAIALLERYGVSPLVVAPRRAVHVVVHPRLRVSFNAAPSTTQEIILERAIDTRGWLTGVLVVRLQAKTSWATGTALTVLVRRASVVEEAPGTLFTGGTLTFADILATATAPRLYVSAFNMPVAAMASVTVRLTQPATASATGADLGIELIGRTASRAATDATLSPVVRPRGGIHPAAAPTIYREPWGARAISTVPAIHPTDT